MEFLNDQKLFYIITTGIANTTGESILPNWIFLKENIINSVLENKRFIRNDIRIIHFDPLIGLKNKKEELRRIRNFKTDFGCPIAIDEEMFYLEKFNPLIIKTKWHIVIDFAHIIKNFYPEFNPPIGNGRKRVEIENKIFYDINSIYPGYLPDLEVSDFINFKYIDCSDNKLITFVDKIIELGIDLKLTEKNNGGRQTILQTSKNIFYSPNSMFKILDYKKANILLWE